MSLRAYCDNVDAWHVVVHEKRRLARELAHRGRFDAAFGVLREAREYLQGHECSFPIMADVNTTESYVHELRRGRPALELIGGADGL